jgi:hypothetical protein
MDDFHTQAMSSDAVGDLAHNQLVASGTLIPRILLPEGCSKSDAIHILAQRTPQNDFGLPTYFIRGDMLPYDLGVLTQDDVDVAATGLFYFEGYPTLQNGTSFWNQLPHEPYQAYLLFSKYIDQAEETGIRQIDMLAGITGKDVEELQNLFREFYWQSRARAHDIFIAAAEMKKREFRIRKMENTHYSAAGSLLDKLLEKFKDEAWIEELNAKEAIEALETLAKIQRLSVGLTGQHASSTPKDAPQAGASVENIIRNMTRGAGAEVADTSGFAGRLQALLENPEEGMVVQEAILRIGRQSHSIVEERL